MSSRVQRWIVCDGNAIVIDDGNYRTEGGWTNQKTPLPPPSECVRIDIEVTQGADQNYRVSAIRAYQLDDEHEKTSAAATLTNRQKQLLKDYIDAKVPPYMLKMGGEAVVKAFIGDVKLTAASRPRKPHRPQSPNEKSLRFTCSVCGRGDATATTGGIALKSIIGFQCTDCGRMLCKGCQKTKVRASSARDGLAGTVVEHLGKPYPYEEWYGDECQFCRTEYEMEPVFGTIAGERAMAPVQESSKASRSQKSWWKFW